MDSRRRYEEVWREFGAALARLAAAYEPEVHAREDLLQDIRLALWKALPGFRGECSMRTFVYRVAHNRGLAHSWKRQSAVAAELPEVGDHREGLEAAAIRRSEQERLMVAVRRLPIAYRQLVLMALEELTQVEMAAVLGISENNVAVRLVRARRMLRDELTGGGR